MYWVRLSDTASRYLDIRVKEGFYGIQAMDWRLYRISLLPNSWILNQKQSIQNGFM